MILKNVETRSLGYLKVHLCFFLLTTGRVQLCRDGKKSRLETTDQQADEMTGILPVDRKNE